MNPTIILKIIAALMPFWSDPTMGQQMVVEIMSIFEAIKRIDQRLERIEKWVGVPVTDPSTKPENASIEQHRHRIGV